MSTQVAVNSIPNPQFPIPNLSYSTNVHPAESLDELGAILRAHVASIMRAAFGARRAAVNLRLGMRQVDELLAHGPLPSTSQVPDAVLAARPSPVCEKFLALLDELNLDVVSINAFPIRDFHAPRVKEQVYSPPWTDGGRALYSLKIAKALTHFMARRGIDRKAAGISVPSGVFKGLYGDSEEIRTQCAHFLTECLRDLHRLERLTGRTVKLGLEPEPLTTGETVPEFIEYFKLIGGEARQKFPAQLHLTHTQSDELVHRFLTVNLDLCHQAIEFEDAVDDLRKLKSAGIEVSGLHLSAALKLSEPAKNPEALQLLLSLDEPRYLHQVVGRKNDGGLARYPDLPELASPRKRPAFVASDFAELRCHFHVPLFTGLSGALGSTRESVVPALRYALKENLTGNFVVETYTWNVLAQLAAQGNAAVREVLGENGKIDVHAGIAKELRWVQAQME